VHTSAWIVSKCLKGDLVRGRTVLLITHNVALVTPVADYVVSLGSDGRITMAGSPSETVLKDRELVEQIAHEKEALELDTDLEEGIDEQKAVADGAKLVIAEEVQQGHVSWKAITLFTTALSGSPVVFWPLFITIRWWALPFKIRTLSDSLIRSPASAKLRALLRYGGLDAGPTHTQAPAKSTRLCEQ
jgi:hypothetical protein